MIRSCLAPHGPRCARQKRMLSSSACSSIRLAQEVREPGPCDLPALARCYSVRWMPVPTRNVLTRCGACGISQVTRLYPPGALLMTTTRIIVRRTNPIDS
jgi:hypothetical protein